VDDLGEGTHVTPPRHGAGAILVLPDYSDPPPRVVEAWLAEVLVELPRPLRLQAALVALELVSCTRGWGTAPFVVRLSVTSGGRALVVTVDDGTPGYDDATLGSDLLLAAGLSHTWGVEQRTGGRTLWAAIGLEPGSGHIRVPGPGDWAQW
jgi:hypothetical protein